MEDILADTHLLGRSFFEKLYRRNNSVTTLVSAEARYVEPGCHECYVVGVPYKESSSLQALLDQYRNMTELELGKNPFIEQDVGGPQYIYIKGDESQMAPYESDHRRGYKLVLDEKPVSLPGEIVSVRATWYRATDKFNNEFIVRFSGKELNQDEEKFLRRTKERNVWGITHPIDYQYIEAGRLSCTVMPRFGRPIAHYHTVLEVLECQDSSSGYMLTQPLHPHPENNNQDASKGILIGFDTAMDLEIEPEKPYLLDGTESFIAIDLSRSSSDNVLPTYRHDLESFFYVFLERTFPANDNFAAIIAEFRQEFKGLESLAHALRDVLFFPDGNDFFTGTNMDDEATEKLYSAMIGAFEKAVVEKRD
ncbi:hypothetical protein H9Q69_005893 [Fusarium xylarioides]|uniref:Fungal-type protein kinase domain-containing protein n=1 Tax=Fusarium xylarioides TaxID=221167 RepID=A0A9P7HZQ5_9HYPO|nr:hypothetical protein H9Q70_002443 [Fusarium xylarioides]KAG5769778.1 hypothetical protein H9Q72_003060 [Fusarium xylarioides]KAG5795050.1 hypothetical protein H9Q69_005893 [Fusarium xylarioides]